MADAEQDRSELPTSYKLQQARRKGTVARGTDLGFLTGLAAFLGFMWISGPAMLDALRNAMTQSLISGGQLADDPGALVAAIRLIAGQVWPSIAMMAATAFFVVLLFEILQTGIVFSTEPLKPDFGKLNPARGFKRIFSLRLLIELAKNIVKLAVYTSVAWLVVRSAVRQGVAAIHDPRSLAALLEHAATRMLLAFTGLAVAVAVLDQLINRRDFLKRMRMSRREVRREMREREGEPRLKQKRRQMHAEFVRMSQSIRAIRGADVLVVNPRHIAVALRYDPKAMTAPTIVSLGTDRFAQRLKRLAFLYNVPVVEDRLLAHALVRGTKIGQHVPETTFQPVADIYNRLRARSGS